MKRYLQVITAIVLLSCVVFGCGAKNHGAKEYGEMQENHPATKTYRDGMWTIRYNCWTDDYAHNIIFYLSADVHKDMTKKDMLDIMDYYEFTKHAQWDMAGNYVGERDSDYTCYAAFYRGDTDEVIKKIKYHNGEEAEVLEEDKYFFASPESHSSQDEIGEDGLYGPLP